MYCTRKVVQKIFFQRLISRIIKFDCFEKRKSYLFTRFKDVALERVAITISSYVTEYF